MTTDERAAQLGAHNRLPTTNEAAERLRCAATRPGLTTEQRCRKNRWQGHPTRYCYQHAIAFGDARVVDQVAVDLLLAAERRATVERIRIACRKAIADRFSDTGLRDLTAADVAAILDEEATR